MSKRHKPEKLLFNNLAKDFHELVSNQQALRTSVENFLNNIIDELTLGIIFDLHRKYKTNAYDLDVDESCDEGYADLESLSQHKLKKPQDCVCPNCDRAVAATHFAPHLEACMGMGRTSRLRNAARRVASNSKDRENSAYGGIASDDDDDDDADWGSRDRRKKKKDKKKGSKKNRGTPKKSLDSELVEQVNVDIEGDDDDLTNLRDILHLQDHSNSTSPADSASSSGSTKKKEKLKCKKSGKRDRSSPGPNLSME